MNNMKKRLAVFLSILFVLPSILSVLPQTGTEVQAGGSIYMMIVGGQFQSSSGDKPPVITIEEGMKFYIGDYVNVSVSSKYGSTMLGTASMLKASYSSSKTNIAAVDKMGLVEGKSEGTTELKVKYKGKTAAFTLHVEKAGSNDSRESYQKLALAAEKIVQSMPSKVTTGNGLNLVKIRADYKKVYDSVSSDVSNLGFEKNGYSTSSRLVVPQAARFNTLEQKLYIFAQKNNPLATRSSKVLKIASVKANSKKVEIKLKKAPTDAQFLSMKITYDSYPEDNLSAPANKVYFNIYFNGKKNVFVSASACMTKGSKTITVIPKQYSAAKKKMVDIKLKKGASYTIGGKYDWTKGKKFKVK